MPFKVLPPTSTARGAVFAIQESVYAINFYRTAHEDIFSQGRSVRPAPSPYQPALWNAGCGYVLRPYLRHAPAAPIVPYVTELSTCSTAQYFPAVSFHIAEPAPVPPHRRSRLLKRLMSSKAPSIGKIGRSVMLEPIISFQFSIMYIQRCS